jgi:hypothetical protein
MLLTHLKPPVVDPAQAPINISPNRIIHVRCGHMLAFAFDSPVVVIKDTTWNKAARKAGS